MKQIYNLISQKWDVLECDDETINCCEFSLIKNDDKSIESDYVLVFYHDVDKFSVIETYMHLLDMKIDCAVSVIDIKERDIESIIKYILIGIFFILSILDTSNCKLYFGFIGAMIFTFLLSSFFQYRSEEND